MALLAEGERDPAGAAGFGQRHNRAVAAVLGIAVKIDPPSMCSFSSASLSAERREPPDIDVDFEHERREEVIQYLYGATRASVPPMC